MQVDSIGCLLAMEGTKEANKTKLLELGFNNEQADHALSRTSNLDDAISLLHEESRDTHTSQDLMAAPPELFQRIEMEEVPRDSLDMSEDPPPYEEVANEGLPVQLPEGLHSVPEETERGEEGADGGQEAFEFPVSNLYELEGRCFVDNWSIPYKRTESLGILLQASTRLALEGTVLLLTREYCCTYNLIYLLGKADENEHCKRFVDRAMHDCLDKVSVLFIVVGD